MLRRPSTHIHAERRYSSPFSEGLEVGGETCSTGVSEIRGFLLSWVRRIGLEGFYPVDKGSRIFYIGVVRAVCPLERRRSCEI